MRKAACMRRVAPASALSPKVLRHFAVLTLFITGGLAMFANGENQSVVAEQIQKRQMQNEALRASSQRATQHTVVIDGLRVAPGTRLAPADVGDDRVAPTNFVPSDPPALEDFPEARTIVPVRPPAIGPDGRDARGMMVPPPAMAMRSRKPGQPKSATRREPPSEDEVNALIQASAQRAGRPTIE